MREGEKWKFMREKIAKAARWKINFIDSREAQIDGLRIKILGVF